MLEVGAGTLLIQEFFHGFAMAALDACLCIL
jgi:hypothetical protein